MPVNSPIFLPLQQQEDNPDFSGQPSTGILTGMGETLAHDLEFGPTAESIEFLHDKIFPGKILTPEDYEKSEWKRPGVNFPNGVSEARAKRSAERHDAQIKYQDEMQGLSNGMISKISQIGANMIGFSLDPVNLAAIGAAVFSGGALSEPLLAAAAEYGTTATLGAKFALGALEGAVATAPSAAVEYGAGKFYGEDPSMLNAVSALAINAGLGGLLHMSVPAMKATAKAFKEFPTIKRIIDSNSHTKGLITATNQLEAGKSVQVAELAENGAYQQTLNVNNEDFNVSVNEQIERRQIQREQIINDLTKRNETLKKISGTEDLQKDVTDQIDMLKSVKSFNPEMLNLIKKPKLIKQKMLTPTEILNEDYDIADLMGKESENEAFVRDTWQQLNSNMSLEMSGEKNYAAPEADTVRNSADELHSVKGDSTYNEQQLKQLNTQIESEKNLDDVDVLKNDVDAIKEQLPEDLQDIAENVDNIQQNHDTVGDEVEKLSNCLNSNNFNLPD